MFELPSLLPSSPPHSTSRALGFSSSGYLCESDVSVWFPLLSNAISLGNSLPHLSLGPGYGFMDVVALGAVQSSRAPRVSRNMY